ncbi:proteasome activator complex subunit 3 [Blastocystis sp. subtype 4]|uniref:proteasome activator complex subunit 3 n=1 Tax=Blastocystis sp. subtype 4 TaxID=944170 RepID=UPI0007118273|nr:proteasome activator complex subunit 3 [Blastocystis sp. subtype 4]KNB46413.1 proteasome activator complex subunit 3 [Blastocystis sp. subtype 4]|eukprot:XP_014529856.1 proteasome activator complex subunit 3 [Blastocystis sp. subtype 4]
MEPFPDKVDVKDSVVPSNKMIVTLLEKVKKELLDLIDYVTTVKFYIKLNQPRKEDGNTFGVEVQNEIVADLSDAMEGAHQMLSDMIAYFTTRASIISNSRKNPHVADYMKSVASNDSKEILVLSQAVIDMRNQYAVLYDRIMKNFDKIVKPTILTAGLKWDSMY